MIGFLMAFLALPAIVMAHTEADPLVAHLIAGNPKNGANVVGTVEVWNDGSFLNVTYLMSDPWPLVEAHLAVSLLDPTVKPYIQPGAIPMTKKGNPIPGLFPYNPVEGITYQIPNTWAVDDVLFIGAHGVAGLCDLDDLELALPTSLDAYVEHPGGNSYFDITITNGGILNGLHEGWCADADEPTTLNVIIPAGAYSTYDSLLPGGIVNIPANLDNVNWLLNHLQDYLGETSPSGGTYNVGDVQLALWYLCDGYLPPAQYDPWGTDEWGGSSDARALELEALALALGEGFEPDCGDVVGIIVVPEDPEEQILLITVQLHEETVWAAEDVLGLGLDFDGNNWALHFTYVVQ